MIGLDADPNKDQESMDASKIASDMLDAPSACRTKRGSVKRRKSALLGLNMEESDSSDEESNKKNRSCKSSIRRKSNYGDTGAGMQMNPQGCHYSTIDLGVQPQILEEVN